MEGRVNPYGGIPSGGYEGERGGQGRLALQENYGQGEAMPSRMEVQGEARAQYESAAAMDERETQERIGR
jgi:hypothetical protein